MFPDSIIIPAIGNNDAKFHYEFPISQEESDEYFGFLYNLWWNDLGANAKYPKKEKVKETLMKGGFFRYDHSKKLSFIALNSLYWSVKNDKYNSTVSHEQLDWFEEQLEKSEKKRNFIVNMHVFPGMYNPGERQQFWLDEFNNRFNEIMKAYGHKVIFLNGAHTHIADVRASWIEENTTSVEDRLNNKTTSKKGYYANFVSPSFSPVYLNNPGFSILNVDEDKAEVFNITAHYLELDRTYETTDHELVYHSVDYEKDFGITGFHPDELIKFMERAKSDDEFFKKFLVLKLGFRLDQEKEALAVYENLNMIDFSTNNKIYWCFFEHMRSDDYDACVNS